MKGWIPYALLAAFMGLLGFTYRYNMPRLKTWMIVQIETQSEQYLPVRILPMDIRLHLFPIGASIYKIHVLPGPELKNILSPARIEEVRVDLDFWQLTQGRIHISEILVSRPDFAVRIDTTKKGHSQISIDDILHFDKFIGVPVDRITLIRANSEIRLNDPELTIRTHDLSLGVAQGLDALAVEVVGPSVLLQRLEDQTQVSFSTRGGLRLTDEELQISDLHIKKGKSILRLNGQVDGDVTKMKFDNLDSPVRLKLQALLELDDLLNWGRTTFPKAKLPNAQGLVKAELDLNKNRGGKPSISAEIWTQNFAIDKFHIGNVNLVGDLVNNNMRVKKLQIENRGSRAILTNATFKLADKSTDPVTFTTELEADQLSLHNLLQDLDVGDLPLELTINGKLPCSGTAYPKPNIKCQGSLKGSNLWVSSEHKGKTIVAVKDFAADGDVTITDTQVKYNAKVAVGNSHGDSQGTIGYETGFDINYATDKLNFADVADLAGLKLEGSAKLHGYTRGDSRAAIFSMDISTDQFWFDDYAVGQADARMNYKSGILYFQNVKGTLGSSRYLGSVSYNIPRERMLVVGEVPFADASDVAYAFSRKFKMPVNVSGSGSAQIKVTGPPKFNQLSYDLKSSLYKGTVAGESFDRVTFNVEAADGEVKTDLAQIVKGRSTINMVGTGHPDGNIDVRISGHGMKLEESENVLKYASTLAGDLDFDMTLKGYVLLPDTILQGTIKNASLNEEPMANSQFKLKFSKDLLEGDCHLLGQTVQSTFMFPYNSTAPFKFDLVTQDFDFSPLVGVLLQSNQKNEFKTGLSSNIHLSSAHGGFWSASGNINVSRLFIDRSGTQMANAKPIALKMRDGYIDVQSFGLEGENTFLSVENNHPARKKMDIAINGKIDMGLAKILTPFLGDLRGRLSTTCQIRGDEQDAVILGTAYLEDGLVNIRQIPHPFQHIKADILFDQRKIILNSVTSDFAGGSLLGEGTVELRGYKNVPVNFAAHLTNIELNIPDQIRSRGDAELQVSGNWFPYLLKGNYKIRGGLMKREFASASTEANVRQSSFLPAKVAEDQFSPVKLDLNVEIAPAFMVKNSLVDANVAGQLQVMGTPQNIQLQGTVTPQKNAKVKFRETEFDVNAASVKFTGKVDDPTIYLNAVADVADIDDFTINLLVQGTAQKPAIKLTSTPAMTEPEIISLLATGVRPERFDANPNETARARDSGTKLGSVLLSDNPLRKEFQEKTGFNVDLGATNLSQPLPSSYNPSQTTDSSGTSVPKIVISRQWTPKFGASASRTVGEAQINDVQFKYQLNHSMSVVGSWENREYDPTTSATGFNNNYIPKDLFGLDLEYKVDFK